MKTQNCDEANRSTRIGAVDQAASIIGADRQHRRWFALSGRAHRSGCGVGWQATGAMTDLLLVAAGWRGCAMPRYMVGGYDDYSVLHLVPVSGNHGVELPAELYQRWCCGTMPVARSTAPTLVLRFLLSSCVFT